MVNIDERSIADRSDYIQALMLPEAPAAVDARHIDEAPWPTSQDSAQINAGILLAFDRSVSRQQVNDVSNSLLFAQLAANVQANRFSEAAAWSKVYRSVLSAVGWSIRQANNGSPVRIDPPVNWAEVIAQAFSGSSGAALSATAMKAASNIPQDSKALLIWETNAAEVTQGNFMVQTSQVTKDELLGDSAQIIYTLINEPNGFLNWTTYYEVMTSWTQTALNEDVYQKVRQQIIDKLGDRTKIYVAPIPL